MNRRRKAALVLVVSVITVTIIGVSRLINEPEFEGRPLRGWLADLSYDQPEQCRDAARTAVRAVGTNALPTLVRMLTATDSTLKQWLIKLEAKQSLVNLKLKRAEDEHVLAGNGFSALGEIAIPAIPQLTNYFGDPELTVRASFAIACAGPTGIAPITRLLSHTNAMIRSYAAMHLGFAGRSEPQLAIPFLLDALNDSDQGVRRTSIYTLQSFTNVAKTIVPALTALLGDPSVRIRQSAALALGAFGTNASDAEGPLISLMADPATFGSAASALLRISQTNGTRALEAVLQDTNSQLRAAAASRIGSIGAEGSVSIPILIEALRDSNENLRIAATNALLQIDPIAATNAGVRMSPPVTRRGRNPTVR